MISDNDYAAYDGLALAQMLYAGEVAPRELMECAIRAAEAVDARLNAFCFPRHEDALEEARAAKLTGTFGALPFVMKDSGIAAAGHKGSIGSRLFAGMRSLNDSTLAARFRADGFISFGRTTSPELCMAPTTEAVQNGGPTRNPWDPTKSSGGSSGGAAVAVATGVVPIAHGSDGGGSIRIPASCCGVFGLKTSRGLVPHGPARGEGWSGLGVHGVLSRSVRDSAAALDGIAGMEPGAPYAAPSKPKSYLASLDTPFDRPLRIARWSKAFADIDVAPDCLVALDKVSDSLIRLGHEVIEAPIPQLDYDVFVESLIDALCTNAAISLQDFLKHNPRPDWQQLLEPAILDACLIGQKMPATSYASAINVFHQVGRIMDSSLHDYDLLITPTLTQPPLPLGALSMADDFRSFRRKAARYTAFLAIFNASGQPAANLPAHRNEAGLPIGVQIVGRLGADADILRVAAALENSSCWLYELHNCSTIQHHKPT